MHNAAAADLQLDLVYVPLPVKSEELSDAISGLVALGFTGANVTLPHKEAVLPLMDHLDQAAVIIGAVNTIVIRRSSDSDGLRAVVSGYNTDWSGFLLDLETYGWKPGGKSCLVLGAGGSARAVAYGLVKEHARVTVASRRIEQARDLVRDVEAGFGYGQIEARDHKELNEFCRQHRPDLIVNATPAGMVPDVKRSPWPAEVAFPENAFVYDLVYRPAETRLMSEARAAGCRVANGRGMLVQQGAQSFELWTGKKPNTQVMATALE
jgi:shikimate dehydrogenase